MKQFTITIPDNKESVFVEWMKSVSFIKKIEAVEDSDIPEVHKKLVMDRFNKVRKNPEKLLDWEKAKKSLSLK